MNLLIDHTKMMQSWTLKLDCEICKKNGIKKLGVNRGRWGHMIFLCNEHQKIYDIQQSRQKKIQKINELNGNL